MRAIKTYRKVGAFYIAWEADFPTPIDSKLRDGLNIRYFPQPDFWGSGKFHMSDELIYQDLGRLTDSMSLARCFMK
jgi:hypothetical protein